MEQQHICMKRSGVEGIYLIDFVEVVLSRQGEEF